MPNENDSTRLITSSILKDFRKVFTDVDRGATLERYKQISGIATNEQFDIAFAEPVNSKNGDRIDWFTTLEGDIYKFKELNEQQIKEVKFKIWSSFEKLDKLTAKWRNEGRQSLAKVMEESIEIPSLDSIYLINNTVVLCNWGFIEDKFNPQRGILRKISAEFSGAKLHISIVTDSSKPISGAIVKCAGRDSSYTSDDEGNVVISDLQMGDNIEITVTANSYDSFSKSIYLKSPNLSEIIVLDAEGAVVTGRVRNLHIINRKGESLPNREIKIIDEDKNKKAVKTDSEGIINIADYSLGSNILIKPNICYSSTPKSILIQEDISEYEVELKNRCWLLLVPILLLLLLVSWSFYKSTVFSPILSVYISGQGEVVSSGDTCKYKKQPCDVFYTGFGDVTITAKPAKGYVFKGWKDVCKGSNPECTVSLSSNERAFAIFEPDLYSVKVNVDKKQGTVYSSIPISNAFKCGKKGSDCEESYPFGEMVDLDAQEYTNYIFDHWEGDCNNPKSHRCKILVDGNKSVQAVFRKADSILSVDILGQGLVKVETNKSKEVLCDSANLPCLYTSFKSGWKAHLTPQKKEGFEFVRWEGACSGSNTICKVNLSNTKKKSVIAIFERSDVLLDVKVAAGQGKVLSSDANINCPDGSCSYNYIYGSTVELEAQAKTKTSMGQEFVFDHWSGACHGSKKCIVVLNKVKHVEAYFRELIKCSNQKVARDDNGSADYAKWMEVGKKGGKINYVFYPYGIPDKLILKYDDHVILDTGCVGDGKHFDGSVTIPSGNDSRIFVEVEGGCNPSKDTILDLFEARKKTGWDLVVQCPTGN